MKKTVLALGVIAAAAFTTPAMAQDAAAGEKIANTRCAACHSFNEGGPNKVGPNLYGTLARDPGTTEGYRYSPGFKAAVDAGFKWTDDNLMAYLADPTAFLRDTSGDSKARSKMTFKLPDEQQRKDVIAYLKTLQ